MDLYEFLLPAGFGLLQTCGADRAWGSGKGQEAGMLFILPSRHCTANIGRQGSQREGGGEETGGLVVVHPLSFVLIG